MRLWNLTFSGFLFVCLLLLGFFFFWGGGWGWEEAVSVYSCLHNLFINLLVGGDNFAANISSFVVKFCQFS